MYIDILVIDLYQFFVNITRFFTYVKGDKWAQIKKERLKRLSRIS